MSNSNNSDNDSLRRTQHIPRGLLVSNVKGAVKHPQPKPGLPDRPIMSSIKGSSKLQPRSISEQPPLHSGPTPNTYYQNPSGYHSSHDHPPGGYPSTAPKNSQIPTTYPYPPASYGGYAAQDPVYAPGPSGQPLPLQGGPVGNSYVQGLHAPPPGNGSPQAPAGSYPPQAGGYSLPAGIYPPPGGYPLQVRAPLMSSNPTPSNGHSPDIGNFVTRPRTQS